MNSTNEEFYVLIMNWPFYYLQTKVWYVKLTKCIHAGKIQYQKDIVRGIKVEFKLLIKLSLD
jgi:hypothetical protein